MIYFLVLHATCYTLHDFTMNFLKEVRKELAKVKWPEKNEVVKMTGLVIIVSVAVGLYVGGLDFLFVKTIKAILK